MELDTGFMSKEEQIFYYLQSMYQRAGYRKFKMRKFEEYSLYLENKNFLRSENVITFNDNNGKLLALKPDVTLSIVKNAKATGVLNEKVYYNERIYRVDSQSGEFREINQLGLEYIGQIDLVSEIEITLLAIKSIKAVDENFLFAISHMGFVTGLIESMGLDSENAKQDVIKCLKSKNPHDLIKSAKKYGISDVDLERALLIIGSGSDFETALQLGERTAVNKKMKESVEELYKIYDFLKKTEFKDKIKLDFSILNDINYYNGIIFQGYVFGCPRAILSGGRYDLLLGEGSNGAMGFALSLQDLAGKFALKCEYDIDCVILYDEKSDINKVIERAEILQNNNKIVLTAKQLPEKIKYREWEKI